MPGQRVWYNLWHLDLIHYSSLHFSLLLNTERNEKGYLKDWVTVWGSRGLCWTELDVLFVSKPECFNIRNQTYTLQLDFRWTTPRSSKRLCLCVCVCLCVLVCVYVYVFVCICSCVCVCMTNEAVEGIWEAVTHTDQVSNVSVSLLAEPQGRRRDLLHSEVRNTSSHYVSVLCSCVHVHASLCWYEEKIFLL